MGFSATFQDLVFQNISDIWYSININGEMSLLFHYTRGVRQGDPLSPLLFIIAQQVFSYNLKKLEEEGRLKPFNMGRGVRTISHLFLADDMLLFTNGSLRSLRALRALLAKYEEASGQKINLQKSSYFPSKSISLARQHRIKQCVGCSAKALPITYLGAPLFKGRAEAMYFDTMIQKVMLRLQGWKTKFLIWKTKLISS